MRALVPLVAAVVAAVVLLFTVSNAASLQADADAEAAVGSMRFEAGQRIGLLLTPVACVAVILASIVLAVRGGRGWARATPADEPHDGETVSPQGAADRAVQAQLAPWTTAFRSGAHYDAVYDRASAARLWSHNTAITVGTGVIGVASTLGVLLLVALEGGLARVLVVLEIFGLVMVLLVLPTVMGARRRLRRAMAGQGRYARVSAQGLALGLVPQIAWSEVLAVIAFDDRERLERTARVPVRGWGARLALRAGNGAYGITIALTDGTSVRARIGERGEPGLVRLWGPSSTLARRGDISLILDPLLDTRGVTMLSEAVRAAAMMNGVPVHVSSNGVEFVKTLGRLLDPKWPAGH